MNLFNCFKRSKGGNFLNDLQSIDLLEISSRELNNDKFFIYKVEKMENVRKIGSTKYSEVFRVEIEDEVLAYKKILSNVKKRKEMSKIFKKLRKLRHDGILPILGGVIDEPNFGYVMPYHKRNLKSFLSSYRKKNRRFYPYLKKLEIILSLAKVFSRMNLENIIHGSIRLENVFVIGKGEKVIPVVGDAIISDFFRVDCADTVTPFSWDDEFMAPELRYFRKAPDIRTDIYKFGWVIYQMISEDFSSSRNKVVLERNERVPYVITELLERLMDPDPSKRMSFFELVKELKRIKELEKRGLSPLRIFLRFRSRHPDLKQIDGKIAKVVLEERKISIIFKELREFQKSIRTSENKSKMKKIEEEEEEEEEEGESDDSDCEGSRRIVIPEFVSERILRIYIRRRKKNDESENTEYEILENDSQLDDLKDDSILEIFPKPVGVKIGNDQISQTCKEEFERCKFTQTGHSINEVTEYTINVTNLFEKEKMERKIESQLMREKYRNLEIQHENITSRNTERILKLEEEKNNLEERLERMKEESEVRINSAISETQRELEKMKLENEKLMEILEVEKNVCKGYKEERNSLVDEVETKNQKIKELEDNNFTLLTEKEEISKQMISKLQELQIMVRGGKDQQHENITSRNTERILKLEEEKKNLEEVEMKWEDKKVKWDLETVKFNSDINKLKNEVKKHVLEKQKLEEEVLDKESDLAKIIKNNHHYQDQIRKLKSKLEEKVYEKKELALEIDHMEKESSIMDIKVERMKDEHQILKIKLESKYIHERKSFVHKYTSTNNKLEIDELENTIKMYKNQNEEQKKEIEGLRIKIEEMENNNKELTKENLDSEKKEEDNNNNELEKLKLENEKLVSRLESSNKSRDRIKRNWDDVRKALFQVKKKESKKKEKMKEIEMENKNIKIEIGDLKKKLLSFQKN